MELDCFTSELDFSLGSVGVGIKLGFKAGNADLPIVVAPEKLFVVAAGGDGGGCHDLARGLWSPLGSGELILAHP